VTRRAALLGLAAFAGCGVPKGAGFDDVKKLVGDRGIARIHWQQGTPEDEKVASAVRDLLRRDLTVSSAVEIALLGNPRLQATYERLGVAQADLVQAGLLRNPTIAGHVGFPVGRGVIEWEASLVGEFLDLFLIPLKKRFARAAFERVKLEVADAVLAVADEARAAFYQVQAAQQVAAMRRTIADATRAAADLAARQHEAGNLSDLDLAAEQGLSAQAKLDHARAGAEVLALRERLNRVLGAWGRETGWTIGVGLPQLPKREPALAHVESFAVAHRLDLAAAIAEANTLAASLRLTRSTRFIGGLEAGVAAHQDADGPRTVGPTLALELPLFDQKQAAIARLAAEVRQAEQRARALAIDIRSEVRAARDRVLASRAAVEYYQTTLVPLRERIVALSQQQYDAMLLGVYQLLAARRDEVNGYREYIESMRDYWIARSDLERAAGGRLPEEIPGENP
jgi:outer membrane protein, heavy metal efflux system